jgi:hypothetical protein
VDAPLPPQAGRVDEDVVPPFVRQACVDGVPRGPRYVAHQHPFLAEEPIQQRRLADVRAADERDLDRLVGRLRRVRIDGIDATDEVFDGGDEIVDPQCVLGRDAQRRSARACRSWSVLLFRPSLWPPRHVGPRRLAGDLEVGGRRSARTSTTKGVTGLDERRLGGAGSRPNGVVPPQAAGVHQSKRQAGFTDGSVDAVACDAGLVGDQRGSTSDQPIEQGALADVGGTDDRDDREATQVTDLTPY